MEQGQEKSVQQVVSGAIAQPVTVCSVLDQFAVLKVSGEDAAAFLQGQLSSDIRELDESRAQYATYSTAKGRMLANFLLFRRDNAYCLLLPAELAEPVCRRLKMFVLRSKVSIEPMRVSPLLLSGEHAAQVLAQCDLPVPALDMQCLVREETLLVGVPFCGILLFVDEAQAWRQALLAAGAAGADREYGELAFIRAGFAWVRIATQEAYVPQMANMELVGAINFRKGCYPGQEIVARMQYLGKSKRRLYRVWAPGGGLQPGSNVFDAAQPDAVVGSVAAVATLEDGSQEALLVTLISAWDNGIVGGPDCSVLTRLDLPYAVSDE